MYKTILKIVFATMWSVFVAMLTSGGFPLVSVRAKIWAAYLLGAGLIVIFDLIDGA